MENASKALIIAGAILISILLIGIGMFLYNAAQDPISEAGSQMDEQATRMFNAKFENYDGKQSGSNVKSLLSAIITNNVKDANAQKVKVTTAGGIKPVNDVAEAAKAWESSVLSTIRSKIQNSHTYTVKLTYTGAIITDVTITY